MLIYLSPLLKIVFRTRRMIEFKFNTSIVATYYSIIPIQYSMTMNKSKKSKIYILSWNNAYNKLI